MDKMLPACLLCIALLLAGCAAPTQSGAPENNGIGANASSTNANSQAGYKSYGTGTRSFYTFTDPREGAFSLEVPNGWPVSQGSGIIRPYIDAGVAFEAKSPAGQGIFFQAPHEPVYVTPNQVLEFAGFAEGSSYDPSGGIAQPMVVRSYGEASAFASELLAKSGIAATNVKTVERPDLIQSANSLVSRQSAAELSFDFTENSKKMKSVVLVRTSLVELPGTGVWTVSLLEYYAPEELMNETELLVLEMQKSFKVNKTWAAQEEKEVAKRLGAIGKNGGDIGEIISSTFEMRSRTMDELNRKWDNYISGVQDVYDPATGSRYWVDSGSKYYWIDDRNNIYGTDISESPLPGKNLQQLTCPDC